MGEDYAAPLDAVVRAVKFDRMDFHIAALAERVLRRNGHLLPPDLDLVMPIPLHWTRRWSRTFDQTDLLSRALAEALGIPTFSALRRSRRTHAQSGLGRRRRSSNLRGAFRTWPWARRRVLGKSILLVDDVLTTGATCRAAARALQPCGPRELTVLVLARAPTPEPELMQGDA